MCTIGVGLEEATFRHHAEEIVGVPFRYRKLFTGAVRDAGGALRKRGWVYNVRILADEGFPDGRRLEARALELGAGRAAALGDSIVQAIGCRELYDLTAAELARDPWATARGPATDPVAAERARVAGPVHRVTLPL